MDAPGHTPCLRVRGADASVETWYDEAVQTIPLARHLILAVRSEAPSEGSEESTAQATAGDALAESSKPFAILGMDVDASL